MKRIAMPTLLALVGGVMAAIAVPAPVAAAPGSPGTPGASHVLFEENFEHGLASGDVVTLADYVGVGGETYSAEGAWAVPANGNGFILDGTASNADIQALGYNAATTAYNQLRNLVTLLGGHNGTTPDSANHAVAAYTATNPGADHIEFRTTAPLQLPVADRFLTLSANVAAVNCAVSSPKFKFYLDDAGTELPVTAGALNVCAGGDGASTVTGDGSILFTGNQLGIVLRNGEGSGSGNDHAFDDIRVLDVSPQLDQSFGPTHVAPGFTSTLTFTVTNTDELASKAGWSFTDNLPAGLTVANRPNFVTTCANGAITAGGTTGATTVGFTGDLTSGQESCTVSIDVVTPADAAIGDTFTSNAGSVTDLVGLDAPGAAVLKVRARALPQVDCAPEDLRATQRWWFFGDAAGLDFGVSGNAVPTHAIGAGSSSEGTTVVTDIAGELLFWANGTDVYNRNHVVMPNGASLTGNISATQTVAAFPALGHPGRYFLVTTSGAETTNGQLRYSTIDMTMDNGLGDVTGTKNVDLGAPGTAAEGLTAVPNADGTGFWVISSQNHTAFVRSYLFDSSGPADPDGAGPLAAGDPVVNAMPTPNLSQYSSFNLSPDLSQLVMTTNPTGAHATSESRIRLLDFDAATGQLAQRMEWGGAAGAGTGSSLYVADFSPSGKHVYATKVFGGGKVYRYTLDGAADGAAVKASEAEIGALGTNGGQVRRGPDGRMYLANRGSHALSVINVPDAPNVADVGFVQNGMLLPGTAARYGLPQMVTGCPLPLLQFEKTVSPTGAAVGDTVTYSFKVTNNTGDDLEALAIDDPMIPVADIDCPVTVVPAGDSVTCTASYVVDAADVVGEEVVNTASMSVVPLGGDPAVDGIVRSDTAILAVLDDPSLAIAKDAALTTDNGTVGKADKGDVITYTFTVTNDGNVPVENVVINDAMAGLSAISPVNVATLPSGDDVAFTATYTVTQADVDRGGKVANTATASGEGPTGTPVTSPGADAEIVLVDQDPSLAVVKDAALTTDNGTVGKADKGDVITYTFTATNDGNVTVSGVGINDAMAGLSPVVPASVASLAPGTDAQFTATYTVTQADVDRGGKVANAATASGTDPGGRPITSPVDEEKVDLVDQLPGLSIDKGSALVDTNSNGVADAGETINYTFRAENTGNVTLTGVSINDALPGLSAITPGSVTLAPTASAVFAASYTVTQVDVDRGGSLVNTATASGNLPGGGSFTSTPDGSTTGLVPHAPGLSIDKSSDLDDTNSNGVADVGEQLDYTFTVVNTGNVTITGVSVTDPRVAGLTPASVSLAPGATQVFTADAYTVTQADVDWGSVVNIASVSGTKPGGGVVTEDDVDEVDTVDPVAVIDVVKASELTLDNAVVGKADVGDVITYTFTVTNSGTGTAHDVSIKDALPGLSPLSPAGVATLAPGQSVVFTATYTTVMADLVRGSIDNVATASYTPPNPGGGPTPEPKTSDPSNEVTVEAGPTQPKLTTKASAKKVTLRIRKNGQATAVKLFDTVKLKGFVAGSDSVGRATLYGPAPKRTASMCTPGAAVKTVTFKPRNGKIRTPKVKVTEPGHYTWVVTTSADEENLATSHKCGLKAESTLVQRPAYGPVVIDTGATAPAWFARMANPARVRIPSLGMNALVDVAQKSGRTMQVPDNVARGGWLRHSAAPGEQVGSAVIAGHVSDNRDRPGQFGKLAKARAGQVVSVTGTDGKVHRYRISETFTQPRTKQLPKSLFRTTGAHQLVLVTCAGKVTYPGGRFHYTENRVVIATPIR